MCGVSVCSLSSYLFGVQTADVPDAADAEGVDDELNRTDRVRIFTRRIIKTRKHSESLFKPSPRTVFYISSFNVKLADV